MSTRAQVIPPIADASMPLRHAAEQDVNEELWSNGLPPFRGLEISWTVAPGRRPQTRSALGHVLSGFQRFPVRRVTRFQTLVACAPMFRPGGSRVEGAEFPHASKLRSCKTVPVGYSPQPVENILAAGAALQKS